MTYSLFVGSASLRAFPLSQPTPYTRQYSFKAFQVANPSTPLPGDKVDVELNAVKATITQILANLALIQRDDGEITSSSIGLEQLDGALISLGFDRPGPWSTSTVYEVDNAVFENNKLYICLVDHTSNVFATDLALGKWVETIDFTTLITDAQAAADDAESFAASASGSAASAAASAAAAAATLAASVLKAGDTMSGPLVLSGSTLAAHAASLADVQKNIKSHATAVGGTVDAIQLTMSPVSTTWTLYERIRWTSAGVNTITNPTISKDGGSTNIVIKKAAGSALATSDLGGAGYECEAEYNGTNVILLNPASTTGYTVSAQTEETAPAVGDFAGIYDLSATAERKMTLANVFKVINGLTEDASPHVSNDFIPTYDASAGTAKKVTLTSILTALSALLPSSAGHIYGLTMSNAADTANDITVAAGSARSEGDTGNMVLAAPITKRMDATWAVGDAQGGLNTGSEANSTWYEVHLIKRSDTGVVDVMFTTTANRATLPTNYDLQRRIGWIRNNGSGSLLQFTQVGDHVTWTTPSPDAASTTVTTTATALTVMAPPSARVRFRASLTGVSGSSSQIALVTFSEIAEGNITPAISTGLASLATEAAPSSVAVIDAGHFELRVSSTSTIEHDGINTLTVTPGTFSVSTYGYIDDRGRLG